MDLSLVFGLVELHDHVLRLGTLEVTLLKFRAVTQNALSVTVIVNRLDSLQ
jgi:hypothetical protein